MKTPLANKTLWTRLVAAWVVLLNAGRTSAQMPPGYNLTEALRCVLLSSAAYCDSTVQPWSCPYCSNPLIAGLAPKYILTADATDGHGYISIDNSQSTVYIVFRGSHGLEDWIKDIEFFKADFSLTQCNGKAPGVSGEQVATGFYNVYQSLQGQLSSAITQLRSGPAAGYNVVVAGHSLGAALAILAAVDMTCGAGVNSKPITVYNYGSPRIGNDAFYELVESLNMRVLRHTHYKDPVPHVPSEDWPFDFHHVAREYYLPAQTWDNNTVHECNGSGEDPDCADQWDFYINDIEDHLNYFGYEVSTAACTAGTK